jgi:multiple sugar transport system ATP-binding protein
MAQVRLENISKQFGEVAAVRDLNLVIPDGEFVVLVGPSGCGKTTTLRMIAGLELATQGKIFIGEREVTNAHPRTRNVAMVF